ncbi:MAG: response regulator transcription factor [bacterium]|nr:response regulator transcription factor [bacterium]
MRILLVEDKIPLNHSLSKILQQESFAVDSAYDGEEALDLISPNFYDLIILDLTLPKIDGLTVLTKIREQKNGVPVLVLTARNQTPEVVTGLRTGADDYLGKPFEIDELLARVFALLRRPTNQKQALFQIDNLTFDPQTGQAQRAGKEIHLSKTESAILHYLFLKQKWIVTKDELLTHVWQNDGDVYDRIIDTYICYLRRKIDKAFPKEKQLLKTFKGRGYQLGINE